MSYELTSCCRGCCFSQTEKQSDGKNLQTGCELGRVEKFKSLDTDVKLEESENGEFFVISRFCTCYRPEEWIDTLTEEEKNDTSLAVRNEISVRMGIIILFDGNKHEEAGLKSTIKCFSNQTKTPRYVVVVTSKAEYNDMIHSLLVESFPDKEKTNIHLVQCTDEDLQDYFKIDEAFKHALNGFYYVIEAGTEHNDDFIEKFDSYINDELSQVVMVKPNNGISGLLVQASLHKLVNGSRTKMNEDESLNTENIIQRVINMGINNGGIDLVKDWSEII